MRHNGKVGGVRWARLVCHICVGSHVLLICRRLNFEVAWGALASVFFLTRGTRVIETCFSGSSSFKFSFASFFLCRAFLRFSLSFCNLFAVSRRRRNFEDNFRLLALPVGVLSSNIYSTWSAVSTRDTIQSLTHTSLAARFLNLFGIFLTLWLAVLLLMCRGTC